MRKPVFKYLLKFSYERTAKQAIGFYLFYVLVIIIVSSVTAGVFSVSYGTVPEQQELIGRMAAHVISIIMSFGLYVLVLGQKGFKEHAGYVLLSFGTFLLALLLGPIGGVVPSSYLTTKKPSPKK